MPKRAQAKSANEEMSALQRRPKAFVMTDSFTAQIEAEDIEWKRKAIDSIAPLYEVKVATRQYEKWQKDYDASASDYTKMSPLRRWLLDHDGEELLDEEHGLRAKLASGGSTDVYDVPQAIHERAPQLYQRLAELGCFSVNADAVKAAMKEGHISKGDLAGFVRQIDKTPRLIIEKLTEE